MIGDLDNKEDVLALRGDKASDKGHGINRIGRAQQNST